MYDIVIQNVVPSGPHQ